MRVRDARFVASAETLEAVPPPAFAEVVFAGRSNVGKSSLINKLVGRKKLVRTSSTPGCTRGINIFRVELADKGSGDGGPQGDPSRAKAIFDLVDLPGFGYAKRSKTERASWGPLIEGFLQSRAGLRAAIVIVDIRRGFQAEEFQLKEFLDSIPLKMICVATKLDKIPSSKRRTMIETLRRETGVHVIGTSATDGTGVEELLRAVLRAVDLSSAVSP